MAQFAGNSPPALECSSSAFTFHSEDSFCLFKGGVCLDDQNEEGPRTGSNIIPQSGSLSELDCDTGINERFRTKDRIHVGTYPALALVGCNEKICKKTPEKMLFH